MAQLNDLLVLGNTSLIGSIKANSDHDLLAHTNEFNFASPKFSGDIYINYRTASGSDGAISSYRFCKGAGSTLSDIYASTFYGALSGNASSATKLYVTKSVAASTQYFIPFVSGNSSGNKDAYLHPRIYLWDTGSRMHLCIGEQGTSTSDATGAYSGGLTINSGSGKGKYVDIVPAAMTGYRTITIPDASGLMLVDGNYKNIITTNGLNAPITITNTTSKPAAKTDLPILKIRYQNTGGTYYTVDAISAIGTGETGSTINNGCLRIGSTSGCLALTAGECGKNMITKHALTNTEDIYLLTDSSVKFYVGCANDAVSSTNALNVTSSSVSPGVNNRISLGTSSLKWSNVYATNLISAAVGNGTNYIAFPRGGYYSTTTSTLTGFLNITLPTGKNQTMLRFKVSIYNYVTNSSVDYYVGGYTYSDGNWH